MNGGRIACGPGLRGIRVGVVLGSALGGFERRLSRVHSIPYGKLPGFPRVTVEGHRGELLTGTCAGVRVAVLSGRAHFYEGNSLQDVVAPVRALARAGVRAVILTNAAGGIRRSFAPGDLMLITDHINAFGSNPLIGANDETLGPRFPDMTEVYDRALRAVARRAARRLRMRMPEGVYVGLHGPSYETPAEIKMWRRLGADAVGMSTVPEAIALRHAGVRVLAFSAITNMAAGILPRSLDHADVIAAGRTIGPRLARLLEEILPGVAAALEEDELEEDE
jgi:purine-nucleoside phosphorylase